MQAVARFSTVTLIESDSEEETKRKLLVVVNPFSGSGKALSRFEEEATPIFKKSGIDYEVFVSKYPGHCTEYLSDLEGEFDGVVGVGGDGIIHEILQGLKDDIPIGHIPCGSGNGLAKSLLVQSGKEYGVKEAAELIAEGEIFEMDYMNVCLKEGTRKSCLMVSMGLVSEVDILSEYFRFLGGKRFVIGALRSLICGSHNVGKLSYLDEDGKTIKHVKGDFTFVLAANTTHCSYNAHTAPDLKQNDGTILLTYVQSASRWQIFKILLGFSDGSYLNNSAVKQVRTKALKIKPANSNGIITVDGERVPYETVEARVHRAALKVFAQDT